MSFQELGKFDRLVKSTTGPEILISNCPVFSLSNVMLQESVTFKMFINLIQDCQTLKTSHHGKLTIFIQSYIRILEKAMAPHSSTLAWKIPWMEEAGGLQSTGSLRVRHDWATLLSLFTCMHWRRKWQPTPVFLPGESQGRGSLVGCRLWGRAESDTTEVT